MTVKVERSVVITQKDGTQVQLEATDKLETFTTATVSCSSLKCASRHEVEAPVTFTFVEELVKENLEAYPEVGDYFISVVIPPRSPSFKGEPLAFCSPGCLKDFFAYVYVAPPPRPVQKPDKVFESTVANPELIASPVDSKANVQKVVFEDGQPKMVRDEAASLRFDELAEQLAPLTEDAWDRTPSIEDLDEAARQPSIAGVTAAVSDATGFAEEQ